MKPTRALSIYLEDLINNYQANPRDPLASAVGDEIDRADVVWLDTLRLKYYSGKEFRITIEEITE